MSDAREIEIEPVTPTGDVAIVRVDGAVEITAEDAFVDEEDRLALRARNRVIARIETETPALEVPNMIRRAVKFTESRSWTAGESGE